MNGGVGGMEVISNRFFDRGIFDSSNKGIMDWFYVRDNMNGFNICGFIVGNRELVACIPDINNSMNNNELRNSHEYWV